jgi:hypothetical protein
VKRSAANVPLHARGCNCNKRSAPGRYQSRVAISNVWRQDDGTTARRIHRSRTILGRRTTLGDIQERDQRELERWFWQEQLEGLEER